MNEIQQLAFDYSALPVEVATVARLASERIKMRLRRTAEDIVEIGRELSEIKEAIGHGNFLPWIEAEFEMSDMTAKRFMMSFEKFGKSNKLFDFQPSVLYLLSAPSTPEPVVTQAVAKAESGEKVTVADVQAWKKRAQEAEERNERLATEANDLAQKLENAKPVEVVKEVVREVVPQDYEQAKAKAEALRADLTKNKEALDRLKKEQAAAIEKGVRDQLGFRQKEIAELEKQKSWYEKNIKELSEYHKKHHDKDSSLRYQEELRRKIHEELSSLGLELTDFTYVDDEKNRQSWANLALFLRQAADAIDAVAVHGHQPQMEAWNKEASQ